MDTSDTLLGIAKGSTALIRYPHDLAADVLQLIHRTQGESTARIEDIPVLYTYSTR